MTEKSERYIQDKLKQEERNSLEENLSKEEKEELAFELGVKEGVENQLREELRNEVSSFEKNASSSQSSPFRWVGLAASVILIATFSYIYFGGQSDLYDQYYSSYPNFEHTAVRGDEVESLKDQAFQAYDLTDYETAGSLFTQLIEVDESYIPAYFFRGMSKMETQNYQDALTDFEVVVKSNTEYKDAAMWYSALSLIKLDNPDKAKTFLNHLNGSEEYATKAKNLAEELR